jgi:hypothetical protein
MYEQDKPRPLFAVGGAFALEEMVALPLAGPFPVLDLISRIALAPKLIRRANGLVGTLWASPSSKGDSSTVPELELEMLSPRERTEPKGEV